MSKQSDNISAAAALNKIVQIRRFKIKEDYQYLLNIKDVRSVNTEATIATGIDLLDPTNKIGFEEAERYGIFLNNFINNNLNNTYSSSFIDDAAALFEKVETYSIDNFKSIPIKIESLSTLSKSVFKAIGVNVPSIIPILKNPVAVQFIKSDENYNFLSLSKLNVKSKELFIIFHTSVGKYIGVREKLNSLDQVYKAGVDKKIEEQIHFVMSSFIFTAESAARKTPANMILEGILKYGNNITIGGETRKFFLEGHNSNLLIDQEGKISIADNLGKRLKGSLQVGKTATGYRYSFAYVIDIERMNRDYEKGIFL